jgi:hypothetical protein
MEQELDESGETFRYALVLRFSYVVAVTPKVQENA